MERDRGGHRSRPAARCGSVSAEPGPVRAPAPQSARAWVAAFRARHGRAPRVLHIGNIANNAYLNSRMLREAGVECHVMCADYYHIMGSPEWEDADISGSWGDDVAPRWHRLDLHGYRRPAWFAQGRQAHCLGYLDALLDGDAPRVWLRARMLAADRLLASEPRLRCALRVLARAGTALRRAAILPWRACRFGWRVVRAVIRRVRHGRFVGPSAPPRRAPPPPEAERLARRFAALFPARADRLDPYEAGPWCLGLERWRRVAGRYDLVHAYSTTGVLPLACELPYAAYEHGTIRGLPFEPTVEGRMCALVYRAAEAVFITNCDNVKAARDLGIERYHFVPHPVNESALARDARSREIRAGLERELGADFVVFHPSRQHWEPSRPPLLEKGNDIFLRGFARFVHERDPRAAAVLVAWGQSLERSRALLEELGVAERVRWVPPLPNREMVRYIHASDLLADQFWLGAFGSTMPKALACGTPAMLYLDESVHEWCFPEMPPVLNAGTPEAVYAGLVRLYTEPDDAAALRRDGERWYRRYHSSEAILETLLSVYRPLIERRAACRPA